MGPIRSGGDLKMHKVEAARIISTYEPRIYPNDGRVVSNFIIPALTSKDIAVYGDGARTRSFCL